MRSTFLILALIAAISIQAQNIGPIAAKEMPGSYAIKKISESPRKVYIETFKVNYQLFATQEESEMGGRVFGGGVRGDVKVKLSVGLDGLEEKALIEATDNIYKEFVERLEKEGYEIIPFENVVGLKEYEGWERVKGGVPSRSQFKGYISVTPTGVDYFVKKVTDGGKEKGTFMDNGFRVSKELDEALVIKASITIPFAKDAESSGSKMLGKLSKGSVNVAIGTGMQMSSISMNTTTASVVDSGVTGVAVFRGGKKFQDNSTGIWILKENVEIGGTMEEKIFKEGAVANRDVFGTDQYFYQLFSADDINIEKMNKVKVDMPAYQKGVELASKKFLNLVIDEIMKYANR